MQFGIIAQCEQQRFSKCKNNEKNFKIKQILSRCFHIPNRRAEAQATAFCHIAHIYEQAQAARRTDRSAENSQRDSRQTLAAWHSK